jgi:phosphotransferase system HPr (HPr) family protein
MHMSDTTDTLVTQTLVITNPQGLHARPAELFARTANRYQARVEIVRAGERVDAKSILHILTMGAVAGTELVLEARGEDAQQAVDALAQLVSNNFADNNTVSQEQAG